MEVSNLSIGVVGLGLMGCSITTCLLMAGHRVVAIAPLPIDVPTAQPRIYEHLKKSLEEGLVTESPDYFLNNLLISEDYAMLVDCELVIECTLESLPIKKSVYEKR